MREGWTYKRWSDVLTIINGKNQSAVESVDGKYPIYGSGGIMGYANDWLCPENCVIIGRKGNINKPIFVTTKFWNVDTAFGLNAIKDYLSPKFLFYFCLDYNFERHNRAVTIPSLTKADLQKVQMPLPPLYVQQSIVAELDKINELIGLKKSQLSDLDSLAQSIFYDMFGDPVENEKGWEVKKWNELFDTRLGKMLDKNKQVEIDKRYKYLANANVKWGEFDLHSLSEMTFSEKESEEFKLIKGDLLICEGGEAGRCAIWQADNSDVKFQKAIHRARIRAYDIETTFVFYYMMFFKKNGGLKDYVTKATIEHLTGVKLNMVPVIIPPLPLQQSFAVRIAAIEQQKQRIRASIKDLETLLSSRMQYWFD